MRNTLKTFTVALAALALTLAVATAGAQAASAPSTPPILVVNSTGDTLTSYPASATGDAMPAATVAADSTPSLSMPDGVALDAAGNAWVTNFMSNTIVEYSKAQLAAGGKPTPVATITAAGSAVSSASGAAFDSAGDLWVAYAGSNSIVEFTPAQLAAGGAQTPAVSLASTSSGHGGSLDAPYFLAFDAHGDLWVPNFQGNTLVEFTPGQLTTSGPTTPAVTISQDAQQLLRGPASITFDSAGDLWVACTGSNSVLDYAPSQLSTGAPAPANSLDAPFPTQAQFDAAGNLWVTEDHQNAIVEFGAAQLPAGGAPAPIDMIQGADTGLSGPTDLAIEQAPTVSAVPPATGPAAGPPLPPAPTLLPHVGLGSRQLVVKGHLVTLSLRCSVASCQGTVRLTRRMLVTIRHGRKVVRRQQTIVLASGNYILSPGQHATIRLRPSAAALTALAQAAKHALSGRVVVSVAGGTTLNQGVTLRATRPR